MVVEKVNYMHNHSLQRKYPQNINNNNNVFAQKYFQCTDHVPEQGLTLHHVNLNIFEKFTTLTRHSIHIHLPT